MTKLSREARDLLARARDVGMPDDASLARAKAALLKRVGAAAAARAATAGTTTVASRAPSTAFFGAKVPAVVKVVAIVAILGAGAAEYHADHTRRSTAAPAPSMQPRARGTDADSEASSGAVFAPRAAGALEDRGGPAAPWPVTASVPVTPPSPAAPVQPEARGGFASQSPFAPARPEAQGGSGASPSVVRAVPEAHGVAAPSSVGRLGPGADDGAPATASVVRATGPASLVADIEHLRAAQRALDRGDAREAREQASRVGPGSPLAQESEGLRVLASCAEHGRGGRDEADAFVRRWPESALLPRVRAACRDE
jgi:hypothetical protein